MDVLVKVISLPELWSPYQVMISNTLHLAYVIVIIIPVTVVIIDVY